MISTTFLSSILNWDIHLRRGQLFFQEYQILQLFKLLLCVSKVQNKLGQQINHFCNVQMFFDHSKKVLQIKIDKQKYATLHCSSLGCPLRTGSFKLARIISRNSNDFHKSPIQIIFTVHSIKDVVGKKVFFRSWLSYLQREKRKYI